jgi:electron-transferring-flavoprotein dehydrogenase
MKSGMLAAEAIHKALQEDSSGEPVEPVSYSDSLFSSWVGKELYETRNVHASFKYGMALGILYSGIDTMFLKGRLPLTIKNSEKSDAEHTGDITMKEYKKPNYPNPDGKLTFDLLTSVSRTGTNHEEDQPSHLVLAPLTNPDATAEEIKEGRVRHVRENVKKYGELLGRVCPAGVYEYVDVKEVGGEEDAEGKRFVINSQNCIHCKTCSIKVIKSFFENFLFQEGNNFDTDSDERYHLDGT